MFTKVLRSFGMRGRVLTLDAPISGDVIPLSEVNDQTFATGLLGQGVAIQPTGTRVIAPADAKVEAIFPTGHAVALNTVDGLDVLIHVGLDTVQLEGKHFTVHAQVGDIVHKGDVLIEFEREAIAAEGYDVTVPILVCVVESLRWMLPSRAMSFRCPRSMTRHLPPAFWARAWRFSLPARV